MRESPCVAVCKMSNRYGCCLGCGRTPAEIEVWPRASSDEKAVIRKQLPKRLKRMKPTIFNRLRDALAR